MDGGHDPEFSRIPTLDDLVTLCRNLNAYEVKYVRATGDIDLLVENSTENIERLRKALSYLPDAEAHKISDTDLDHYRVVRVAGEITVDLLGKACDVTYPEVRGRIQNDEIDGVNIPYLMPELLIKTKMGMRPKDVQDRNYLQRLIDKKRG
jgi:hypothetical protein